MIITVRVDDVDGALIKRYASYNKETVSNLIKRLLISQIEEDYKKLLEEVEVMKKNK